MKKIIVYMLLAIMATMSVSAWKCDVDGDGDADISDFAYMGKITSWYRNQELCYDLTNDGIVNIADFAYFGQHYRIPGWCYQTFGKYMPDFECTLEYPEEPGPSTAATKEQPTCNGGGMSEKGLGMYLFGNREYFSEHKTIYPELDKRYITIEEHQTTLKRMSDKWCEILFNPNSNLAAYNRCVKKLWNEI